MATKTLQIKEADDGTQTASYCEYDEAGNRTVNLNNPLAKKTDMEAMFKEIAPSVVTQAVESEPEPVLEDETLDADPANPVAESSADYVEKEVKKYRTAKDASKVKAKVASKPKAK